MKLSSTACCIVLATSSVPAFASTITANAYAYSANANPRNVMDLSSGDTSASASVSQTFPVDGSSASASGAPGALHLKADAGSIAGGNLSSQANASWADRFSITAAGEANDSIGYFSAFVTVNGSLLSTIVGRSYATSDVYADIRFDALTNPLNGAVATLRSHGEAHDQNGYDTGEKITGTSSFILQIVDMPFLFGRPIDFSLSSLVDASLDTNDGSGGEATADYSHTLTWGGITSLRDGSGNVITDYSALSPTSGFNFAGAMTTAVPEPSVTLLVVSGVLGMAGSRRRRRDPRTIPALA